MDCSIEAVLCKEHSFPLVTSLLLRTKKAIKSTGVQRQLHVFMYPHLCRQDAEDSGQIPLEIALCQITFVVVTVLNLETNLFDQNSQQKYLILQFFYCHRVQASIRGLI
jgi:hypothetical protein